MCVFRVVANNFYFIKKLTKYSPSRPVVSLITLVLNTIDDLILNILFLPFIYSAIANNYSVKKVLFFCGIMICALTISTVFGVWRDNVYIPKSNLKISKGFQTKLFKKSKEIDLVCYDIPEFYNKYVWAMSDADTRAVSILNTITEWLNNLFVISSVVGLIFAFEPIMIIFALFPVFVSLLLNFLINKIQIKYDKEKNRLERQRKYAVRVVYLPNYAKELRLFNIFNVIIKIYDKAVDGLIRTVNKFGKKIAGLFAVQEISISIVCGVVALLYLSYQAIVKQSVDIGIIVALSNSIWQVSYRLNTVVNIFPKLHQHSMYIENYKKFISMEPEIKENHEGIEPLKGANDIELRNVSFRYDKNSDYILKNINMKIKPGEKIAIVGHNGAGKTTLIKLIMRLYLPDEGEIMLDGREAGEYKLSSYRNRFGIVFQDFQLYAASVSENVIMDECTYSEEECDKVNKALKSSGMYERIYNGNDNDNSPLRTSITKEFDKDGFVFSGGQAQKIAIARVFARDCGVVVLDEPSSALDPISEYEMHKNMLEAARNKTVILISHRLSTTKDADRIYYLENGMILEEGSHDELMSLGGKYAQMFNLQAEKYED